MKKKNAAKNRGTEVKKSEVRKLTPDDLKKITGGLPPKCDGSRDCWSPTQLTCQAYLVG